MSVFSERLRSLRKSKGKLQKEIAEILNISDRSYRSYEAGAVDASLSKLIILADYYDVSLDYLAGRSDVPEQN